MTENVQANLSKKNTLCEMSAYEVSNFRGSLLRVRLGNSWLGSKGTVRAPDDARATILSEQKNEWRQLVLDCPLVSRL